MDETAPPMGGETYRTRKSVLESDTLWRLTPQTLVRERVGEAPSPAATRIFKIAWRVLFPFFEPPGSDDWPDRVAYDEITSIRLRYDPTRFDLTRRRCDLVGPGGARVSVFSTRYVSVATFEDQAQTFQPFVDELTCRVIAARPTTPIYSGLSWTAYVVQHGLLLIAIWLLASVLGMAGVPALGSLWAKVLIALTYVGACWAYMKRNWPRRINPPPR